MKGKVDQALSRENIPENPKLKARDEGNKIKLMQVNTKNRRKRRKRIASKEMISMISKSSIFSYEELGIIREKKYRNLERKPCSFTLILTLKKMKEIMKKKTKCWRRRK